MEFPFLHSCHTKEIRWKQYKYEPDFPLRWMLKDLQLDQKTAGEFNIDLPITKSASDVYTEAVKKGFGDLDFSAVYKYVNEKE